MATYGAEGIVLKYKDFAEADRLVTLYTKQYGKLRIVAKGVRRLTSRKGGNIELLNYGKFYIAEGRNLDILTEVLIEETFNSLKADLEHVTYAYYLLELVDVLTAEGEPNTHILENLLSTLDILSQKKPVTQEKDVLVLSFIIKTLITLGFWSDDEVKHRFKPSEAVFTLLQQLDRTAPHELADIQSSPREFQQAKIIGESFLHWVLEKELKSPQFIKEIERLNT